MKSNEINIKPATYEAIHSSLSPNLPYSVFGIIDLRNFKPASLFPAIRKKPGNCCVTFRIGEV